jgi:hypothetical protein
MKKTRGKISRVSVPLRVGSVLNAQVLSSVLWQDTVLTYKNMTLRLFKVLPAVMWAKYCTCSLKHLNFDKMKSHWVVQFFIISCSYSFVVECFFPATPTFGVFDFMAVFKAESADHPWWEGREM